MGGAIRLKVEIGAVDLGGVVLLDKGVRDVEGDDNSFLEEFSLDTQVHVHGGRGDALRIAVPVVEAGKAQVPKFGGDIVDIEIRIEGAVVLVFIDRLVVGAISAVDIVESQIEF